MIQRYDMIKTSYDSSTDVFYITLPHRGKPEWYEEVGGLILRYNYKDELQGITIMDYKGEKQ